MKKQHKNSEKNATQTSSTVPESLNDWRRNSLMDSKEIEPTLLRVASSNIGLLYPERVNEIHGEPESGKSLIAVIAVVQELRKKDGQILYIDMEDCATTFVNRLKTFGATRQQIESGRIYYATPSTSPLEEQNKEIFDEMCQTGYSLAVIDGVTTLASICGYDGDDGNDITEMYKRVIRPLTQNGTAVLLIDHVVKNSEQRGRYATGSLQKLAQVDGASYYVTASPTLARGQVGQINMYLAKDRTGHVSQHSQYMAKTSMKKAATILVDSCNRAKTLWQVRWATPEDVENDEKEMLADSYILSTYGEDSDQISQTADYILRALENVGRPVRQADIFRLCWKLGYDKGEYPLRNSMKELVAERRIFEHNIEGIKMYALRPQQ